MYEQTAMGAAPQVVTIGQPIMMLSPQAVQQRVAQQEAEDPSVHAEEVGLREGDEGELFLTDQMPWYVWGLGGAAVVGATALTAWWVFFRKPEGI